MSDVSILPGRERRRKWTVDEKLSIVDESWTSGARVADVARRHGLHPNQVHTWRQQARTGRLAKHAAQFLSVAIAEEATTTAAANAAAPAGLIEIVLRNGRIVRVSEHIGLAHLVRLADALDSELR
jgi:transposase